MTITALPTATIAYAGSPYCATGTANVTQTGQAGGAYSSTAGLTIDPATGAINLATSTAGTYTVTYSFGNGTCTSTTTASVVVNTAPTPSIVGSNPVCQSANGSTETYSTPNVPGNSYNWTVVGGTFTGQGTNQIVVTWTTPGSGSVSVVETGSNGCIGTTTLNITINAAPATSNIYHN